MSEVSLLTDRPEDSYPEWRPAPDSFLGTLRFFIYRDITGASYRSLETDQVLKPAVDGEMECAPVLTAGEAAELVSAGLIPPD